MENEHGKEVEKQGLLEEARSLRHDIYTDEAHAIQVLDRVVQKAKELREKYPNYTQYQIYHLLIGSTPPEGTDIYEDFPGDDSVVEFLKKLKSEFSSAPE